MSDLNSIKIKNTPLDRRIKVTNSMREAFKVLRNSHNWTYDDIASAFNVSSATVRYNLLGKEEKDKLKEQSRLAKAKWYYSLTAEERKAHANSWQKSTNAYKEALLKVKTNNPEAFNDVLNIKI